MYEQAVVVVVVIAQKKKSSWLHTFCFPVVISYYPYKSGTLFFGMVGRISRGAGGINLDRWEIWNRQRGE